ELEAGRHGDRWRRWRRRAGRRIGGRAAVAGHAGDARVDWPISGRISDRAGRIGAAATAAAAAAAGRRRFAGATDDAASTRRAREGGTSDEKSSADCAHFASVADFGPLARLDFVSFELARFARRRAALMRPLHSGVGEADALAPEVAGSPP